MGLALDVSEASTRSGSAMRRLTDHERIALQEVGEPGEGPIPNAVFSELAALGWGYWAPDGEETLWFVTAQGREALRLDTIARGAA
jgi:hypothetical protein